MAASSATVSGKIGELLTLSVGAAANSIAALYFNAQVSSCSNPQQQSQ